jgi:hypothetical protein
MMTIKKAEIAELFKFKEWKEWADGVDTKLNLILAEVQGKTPISPELEKQVRATVALTRKVDLKVPDKPTKKG